MVPSRERVNPSWHCPFVLNGDRKRDSVALGREAVLLLEAELTLSYSLEVTALGMRWRGVDMEDRVREGA